MKVLIINSVCGGGSTGRIVSDMWTILKQQGHTVKIAYGVGEATRVESEDVYQINDRKGYLIHNAVSRITDRTGFYSKAATRRLVQYIESYKPDLIHLHNLHGYYLNLKVLFQYLAQADIPVVWTLHDCWAFTGHCAHFDYIGCDRWKTGCFRCPAKKSYPKSYVMDQSLKNYCEKKALFTAVKNMVIITPSEWLAGLVRQSFLGKYEVRAIPNGIDLNIFKPTPNHFKEEHGLDNKIMVLGVANVWSQRKGYVDMLSLAEKLGERYKVVMVGLTAKQCRQVPETILPIQRTSSIEELARIYTAADVFVNPTYEDNFPTTNLEALACGTPIVTYRTGGSVEAADVNSGLIVEKGDRSALEKAIVKAMGFNSTDASSRAALFDKNRRYQEYIELYEHALKNVCHEL